jgi:hypothetical protein
MCKVGYDGDGTKECKVKPGWEAVLKAQEPSLGTGMAVGPDGTPVLQDNQQQRDLRAQLEEERVKAQFAARERDRTRRIQELHTRIMEYEEMRRHRKVAEDNAAVRALEQRVENVARSSAEIAAQKAQQLKLLTELKAFEEQQEQALKSLVQEKADLVLQKAKEEAARLAAVAARRPQLPPLNPPVKMPQAIKGQNYVDRSTIAGMPTPLAVKAASSTASTPIVAGGADLPNQSAGNHQSGAEAAAGNAVIPSMI